MSTLALILLPCSLRPSQAVRASVMVRAIGTAGARNAGAPPGAVAG